MPDIDTPAKDGPAHVYLLVDESGSMDASRDTTISSINDFLQGLKSTLSPESYVTVMKFDTTHAGQSRTFGSSTFVNKSGKINNVRPIFSKIALKDVRLVTKDDYKPNGGTPLYDAIGRTMIQADISFNAESGPVFFAILTDGEENESTEFNQNTIKKMISDRTEKGWTFTFMGVDIDAYAGARNLGIAAKDTVGLSRATLSASGSTLSASYGRKFEASRGIDLKTYATFSMADATFSDEDKSVLEEKK